MKMSHQVNMPVSIACRGRLDDLQVVSAKVIFVLVAPIKWAALLLCLLLDGNRTVRPPGCRLSTATGKGWRPLNCLCVSCPFCSANEVGGVKSVMWGQSSDPANTSRADLISQCTADSPVMRSALWPPRSTRRPVVISSSVAHGVSITWCQLSTSAIFHDPPTVAPMKWRNLVSCWSQ